MAYEKISSTTLKQTTESIINKEDLIKDKENLELEITILQNKISDIDSILNVFKWN